MKVKITNSRLSYLFTGLSAVLAGAACHAGEQTRDLNVSVHAGEVLSVSVGKNVSSEVSIGVIDSDTLADKNRKVDVRIGHLHHIVSNNGVSSVITIGPMDDDDDADDDDEDMEDEETEQEDW
jgi:hypothetical protein